ncbi:MBL fold metallo-hydrolase RNA specificity domain-containing protein [Photobacterium sp. Hal280]
MLAGVETVKIHGEWIPLRASIKMLSSLSGHADYLELTQWLQQSALAKKTPIQLIHGDPEALEALRVHLQEQTKFTVDVAGYWSILRL